MHIDKVDMPWDGALPMLRHERLQLKVIVFPVPLLFSSSLLLPPSFPRFLFFAKRRVSPSLCRSPRSYSLLAFNRPPSLCLTPALSCLHRNLLLEMATVQQRRFWQRGARVIASTCVCVCVGKCVWSGRGWVGEPLHVWMCVCVQRKWQSDGRTLQQVKLWKTVHAGAGMLITHQKMRQKYILPRINLLSLTHSISLASSCLFPPWYTLYSLSS